MAKAPATTPETPVAATDTVEALTPIHHDGVAYAVGALITMTSDQAALLIELGAARTVVAADPAAPAA